jgi:predicted nuclease of predicted toxin-antitoxin system
MRVLLDENLDRRLKQLFDPEFQVSTVAERGWSGKKNGELLRAAAAEFDVMVTMDRGIEYQQNLVSLDLGIVLISARSNRRQDVEPVLPAVNRVIRTLKAGELVRVSS